MPLAAVERRCEDPQKNTLGIVGANFNLDAQWLNSQNCLQCFYTRTTFLRWQTTTANSVDSATTTGNTHINKQSLPVPMVSIRLQSKKKKGGGVRIRHNQRSWRLVVGANYRLQLSNHPTISYMTAPFPRRSMVLGVNRVLPVTPARVPHLMPP